MTAPFTPTVAEAKAAGFQPGRRTVEVVDHRQLADAVHRLTFRDTYIAQNARPAQFVNLYAGNPLHIMPRPFGVADVDGDLVSVVFAVVGEGTREFARLRAGDHVDVLGPLGRPFRLERPSHYLLVGGGLGVPPLINAAQKLAARDDAAVTAVLGYRDVHFADEFFTQFGIGVHSIDETDGNVVTVLERLAADGMFDGGTDENGRRFEILSCGPLPMMKAVAQWAARHGFATQFSMEQRMGCGYGTCVVCTIDTAIGRLKVCSDGPVFTGTQLGWTD
ncbi:dihydroorotate dehydrogenase electron transfer subunit [Bifidobacterium choloepi]|uniref:Dihydroorotate dehydrogenase electron transfer subunit n=1 Tax=Bifidobacterium choloepi TaxID=2614131 RepID=A0A6I5NFM9_9BIFI|nr:dihydroorotate dehydrogenase electron transfer subunit [Bifidobacterium choloepi]NEG69163.1 dihydroorotate dehydrogenase electron transfer subunit [Bifidobacterium choloepi]